jgi:hypothetical protein
LLSLLLSGCVTNSKGQVSLAGSTGVAGGVLILGGATLAAGVCQPNPDRPSSMECDDVKRGDPVDAIALVLAGVSLMALAVLIDRVE